MGTAEDTAAEMNAAIRQTSEYLESEVKAVMRGMQSFGISEAEAKKILNAAGNGTALQNLRAAANRVSDPAKREALLNAIDSAGAYRYRITRIEALNRDVVQQCRELYKTENRAVTSALRNVAQESYYREIFGIQKGTGLGFGFSQFSQRDVERILRSNWAGGNYSQRIWRDINGMTARLKQELLVSMLTGRSGEKTARIFRERFGVNAFCARRIVRTESAYVANAAQAQAYDEAGIERYRFIATLDSRTCECCGALDGKVFDLAKAKAGTNYPPMHPFCRSTTIADFGDEEFAQLERRAKDKDGKTVRVPASMTYEEWRGEFVDGKQEKLRIEETTGKMSYMSKSFRPKFEQSKPISYDTSSGPHEIKVKRVSNSKFDMVTDESNTRRSKAVRYYEKSLNEIQQALPKKVEMPKIAVVDFDSNGLDPNAIGGYDKATRTLYLNSKYDTPEKILKFVSKNKGEFANNTEYAPVLHEIGHKYYEDAIKRLAESKKICYNEAQNIVDSKIAEHVKNAPGELTDIVSEYANKGYKRHKYTEVIAECYSAYDTNSFAKMLIDSLEEVV